MLKSSFSLILFIAANQSSAMNIPPVIESAKSKFSTKQKLLIGGTLGVGITAGVVVIAPYVLPEATIIAIKAAVAAAAVKAGTAAATIATKIATAATAIKTTAVTTASGIASPTNIAAVQTIAKRMGTVKYAYKGVHFLRWYVYPTTEQNLEQLLQEDAKIKASGKYF